MTITNNAQSGALAAQMALDTASQNIANLQTKGYTRQGVLLSSLASGGGQRSAGYGVEVSSLLRFSDGYKNQQMWRAAADLGQRSQSQPYLTQLERVMTNPESSLSNGIDTFFKALNAADVDPSSLPLRQQVVSAADALAQHFNSIDNVFSSQLLSVQQQRDAITPKINATAQSIASLNQQIATGGANSSALIDQRDRAIDSLSSLVALDVVEQPDGSRSVSLRGGQPLVVGNLAATLSSSTIGGIASYTLTLASSRFPLETTSLGGQLGGLSDFEQNVLRPLRQSVSEIASALASRINTQLAAGTDLNGNPGAALFVFDASNGASLLQVAPGITAPQLAFSGDGAPGDSGNLKLLLAIRSQNVAISSIGAVALDDADTQLVGKLGIDSQQNQSLLSTAGIIREQAENDWKSTSGVNQDEEAVSLIEYQKMYQANMKVISVANSLFDSTLAMFN